MAKPTTQRASSATRSRRSTTTSTERSTDKARETNLTDAAAQRADSAKAVGIDVSGADIAAARREGALQAERDAGADAYRYATDGALFGITGTPQRQFTGYDEIMQYAGMLTGDLEGFLAAIAEDAPAPIPEEKVYGLLALERNGQNRTPYVQGMMKRLDLDADQLPGGGPGYTNDVRPITELK